MMLTQCILWLLHVMFGSHMFLGTFQNIFQLIDFKHKMNLDCPDYLDTNYIFQYFQIEIVLHYTASGMVMF